MLLRKKSPKWRLPDFLFVDDNASLARWHSTLMWLTTVFVIVIKLLSKNSFFSIRWYLAFFVANVAVQLMLCVCRCVCYCVCALPRLRCLRLGADGSTHSLSAVAPASPHQDSQTAVSSVRDSCTDCTSTFTPTRTFHCTSTYLRHLHTHQHGGRHDVCVCVCVCERRVTVRINCTATTSAPPVYPNVQVDGYVKVDASCAAAAVWIEFLTVWWQEKSDVRPPGLEVQQAESKASVRSAFSSCWTLQPAKCSPLFTSRVHLV